VIGPVGSMPIMPLAVRPVRQASVNSAETERDSPPAAAPARGHKSALAHAHELADDATALAASFGQRRAGRNDGSQRGAAEEWAGRLLEDGAHGRVTELKNMLLAHTLDAAGLQQALLRLFSDISDAYAALRSLLADDELEAHRELLDDVLRQLAQQGGPSAKAGANAANTARTAAARHRGRRTLTPAALRASYRSLLGSNDALQLYVAWLEVFGDDERQAVVDFLTEALVADMCCADPSCSAPIFGRMLRSARLLSCLRTLERRFCGDPLLLELLGHDAVAAALRPMLHSFCDEDDARAWCEALLENAQQYHDTTGVLQLCLAVRRFIKSINSPEVLYPACRAALLDCLDARTRALLEGIRPTTYLLET